MSSSSSTSIEYIPGKLYYISVNAIPVHHPSKHYFCIDNDLLYWNFFLDFGPLNLGHLYRYCALLNSKLTDPKYKDKQIYHYSGSHINKRTNAVYLLCAWAVLYLNKTSEEAFQPFKSISNTFAYWHDATPTVCTFQLTILDTLRGLYKARQCSFFNFDNFNIDEYEHYEQVENGDLNWLMENKFIAFAGPHAVKEIHPGGYHTLIPEDYTAYFKKKNVSLVVRLNKKYYDSKKFTAHGINHMELYFLDGSNPPDSILSKFLAACEETSGAIAVHCKAGLGRTGSCVGCYMMKHFKFTAEEVIGWLRIVRPGSIIGPQQQFMKDSQMRMWREGELYRARLLPLSRVDGSIRNDSEGTEVHEPGTPTRGLSSRISGLAISAHDSSSISKQKEDHIESQGDSLRARRFLMKSEPVSTATSSSSSSSSSSGVNSKSNEKITRKPGTSVMNVK